KLHAEYADEINVLQQQVAKNTKQIEQNTKDIDSLKNGIAGKMELSGFIRVQYDHDKYSNNVQNNSDLYKDNDRFYMSLNGSYKVNDNWKAKFQLEKNSFYNGGHDHENESGSWATDGRDKGRAKRWSGHDGDIQRIWVEGTDPKTGAWINIGRAWRGLGQQNVLFGTESDGFQLGVPIKGTSLTASGFWFASTNGGNHESWYGLGTWGNIGPRAGINVAYALNSKHKGDVYEKSTSHLESWGEETVNYDKAYVLSGWLDLSENTRLLADYVQTNADYQNNSTFLRLNYRNTDLQKPGTWQAYARWYRYGTNGTIAGDDEWSSLFYNGSAGSKGWILGYKYVPWKNIEWETLYSKQEQISNSDNKRTLVRTQMDFHF
ncbi:S-layer homology domain-containing protein, partial [Megasphaera sp.]